MFDRVCGRVGFSGIHSAEQSCLTDVALRFEVYVAAPSSIRTGNSASFKAWRAVACCMSSPNSVVNRLRSTYIARFTTIQFWTFVPASIHPPLNKRGGESPPT
ncbi:MAG TPA: hypothetical protein VHQ21_18390 [Rhodanobacteraceae bacterium]|nr:hypothetical protein [Rhodanobacteraceae bacterium]